MNDRLDGLRGRLAEEEIRAALLVHPRDVFYYAGTVRPATLLVGPQEAVLFVRRGVEMARREATVERVEPSKGFRQVAAALLDQGVSGTLGVDLDVTPANLYLRMREALSEWLLADVSPVVLAQRMVKDDEEIEATRQAAAAADAGHRELARVLRPGMTEIELAVEVEAAIRRAGHEGYLPLRHPGGRGGGVFMMSGEHLAVRGGHGLVVTGAGLSPSSPYGASRRRVQPGDLVVLDIGTTCLGYTGDVSRTYVVGKASAVQEALYQVALAAEQAMLAVLRPGTPVAEVYAAAEAVVAQGAPPHFRPGDLVLPGFAGHGIGLELDEPPVIWAQEEMPLQAGMVLAVEVEVNVPAAGLMAKVEDTVVVGLDAPVILTLAPRGLTQVM